MILFINTFLTNEGFLTYQRGLLPSSNKIDVFKYCLASLSVISWSRVIIYYDLDDSYSPRRPEIDDYIRSLFPDPVIYHDRNQWQWQWRDAMENLFDTTDDDFVWFLCNHDHVFIDYETALLERIESELDLLATKHEYVSCYFSHWPEALQNARTRIPGFTDVGVIEEHRDYFVTLWHNHNSMQIVNKNLLRYWWFEHDYGDNWMPRSDPPGVKNVISPETACIIPYRELVRHFDGYSHNGIDINVCPPLFIPDGFFSDGIRVQYSSKTKRQGFVDVNPMKKNYSTVDPNGADLKCTLDDLPLFWRSRISEVAVVENPGDEPLLKGRNEAVLRTAWEKIQLPVEMLETSLRLTNTSDVLKRIHELGQLKRFAASYKVRKLMNPKGMSRRGRNLARSSLSRVPMGNKILGYLRTSKRSRDGHRAGTSIDPR